ncbi:MAG TPA: hypothetical protein VLJ39_13260 [Tepidisphaeraceae bacterium]|nr:hypothetical protein [Tepidisphaeraceae bacterium]
MRTRRGFLIAEAMTGLALLTVAATVLLVGITRQSFATHTLSDAREATRLAEATLSRLQAGQPPARPDQPSQVRVTLTPAGPDQNWANVTVTVASQTRSLVGLVPQASPTTAPAERSDK